MSYEYTAVDGLKLLNLLGITLTKNEEEIFPLGFKALYGREKKWDLLSTSIGVYIKALPYKTRKVKILGPGEEPKPGLQKVAYQESTKRLEEVKQKLSVTDLPNRLTSGEDLDEIIISGGFK